MNKQWTREEAILALLAYCQVPFNKASNSHPWIIRIANAIHRTPAAVKMKIGNFGVFDPALRERGIVGLSGYSKIDKEVWNEFYGKWDILLTEATKLLKSYESTVEDFQNLQTEFPNGEEIEVTSKRRINQIFFRNSVLSAYNNHCCISGISSPTLLEAAHIIAWKDDDSVRTDPSNGLCLNTLFHKAFDSFMLSIAPDYTIDFSPKFFDAVSDPHLRCFMESKQGAQIALPDKFLPNPTFLNEHYTQFKANSL